MNSKEQFAFDRKTQEILENLTIPFGIFQCMDKRVVTVVLSQGFCDEFGFKTLEDAYQGMSNNMYLGVHPDDKSRVADAVYRFAAFDDPFDLVYRTRTLKDENYIIVHTHGKSIFPEPDVRLCLVWYASEGRYSPEQGAYESVLNLTMTRLLKEEENQYRQSYYDNVTGLPNTTYFFELAEAGCKRMKEQGIDSAILFFDLSGLKDFNRWHGFAEGNRLIRAIAEILKKHFSNDNCSRFSQDHFAAFAPEEGLAARLDSVIAECAKANEGNTLPIRIGIYPNRIEEVEVGAACDRAKMAANISGKRNESYYAYFNLSMMLEEKNRQNIIGNLDRAIEEGWIQVYYQPIVRSTNGKVCDAEVLARWKDPERGILMPASFIPVLEDAMLIHKLDLYVVRRALKDLKENAEKGNINVPISVNFSRADFDVVDLVEEICKLTDEMQVDRKLLNIEITESMVGSNFEYMKEQIRRFREQGFQVWMDDFGSGYSSLEVLQSLKFDLIKFDMGFMRRLNDGDNGKIILTEMMKMATSLGVDTVCEGVETEEQVRFLQEIGCAKLQGFFFMPPVPREEITKKYYVENQNGFEDPRESSYYDTVGRVNLYDLSFLANMDDNVTKNTFDTVPMGIMELKKGSREVRVIRSNRSFREFFKRCLQMELTDTENVFTVPERGPGSLMLQSVEQSRNSGNRAFFEEAMADGSITRSFIRRIGVNPVSGKEAVALAVLSVTEPNENATFAHIARALAADYYNIYIIDLDTNEYIEYSSEVGREEMSLERHGGDFFESAKRDTMTRIYEADRAPFLAVFTKENVLRDVETQGVFTTTYRLIDDGIPLYVNMKVTRMYGGNRLILGVSVVDHNVKERMHYEELQRERGMLVRVMALSDDYLSLFTVDPETGTYVEYSSTEVFDSLGAAKGGDDFFEQSFVDAGKYFYEPDIKPFREQFTRENVMRTIRETGKYSIRYRLMINGEPKPAMLKAALFRDGEEEKLVVGVRALQERK